VRVKLALVISGVLACAVAVVAVTHQARSAPLRRPGAASPIQHVVIVFQENHSFDDVLGKLCATAGTSRDPCDGATTGKLHTGDTIPLAQEPDIVPTVRHNVLSQRTAINGGQMNGFDLIKGCESATGYACYAQFDPSQIPNLAALARSFVISDRTFEFATTPSWGGHFVLAAATLDGFTGDNPKVSKYTDKAGPWWGCDSHKDAMWWNGTMYVLQPSCVPDESGNGPYRPSLVPYVPTIFDRIDQAGLTWRLYAGNGKTGPSSGYGWTICPTFYECFGSSQRQDDVPASQVIQDAAAGNLPNLAIVTPTNANSQHNQDSMAQGDNWIGRVVGAIERGANWSSTAIFIAYDDCGCLYDHVPPPSSGMGVRVPMVIVSPYAKAGYTDSATASYMSMLAYTEHTFGLPPLSQNDGTAYDYANSFDYSQAPLPPVGMTTTPVPTWERAWIAAHPAEADDPT
jgi:phospholipase C